jgi:hypothetical protein
VCCEMDARKYTRSSPQLLRYSISVNAGLKFPKSAD